MWQSLTCRVKQLHIHVFKQSDEEQSRHTNTCAWSGKTYTKSNPVSVAAAVAVVVAAAF